MLTLQKHKFIVILLQLFLLTACAQADPTPLERSEPPSTAPTPVVVRILNLDLVRVASPTAAAPTPTPLPTLAPPTLSQPPAEPAGTNTAPACINRAEFVKNLMIADFTAFKPGQSFAKIWQIKNTGTCVWTTEYAIVYASGESMGSPASVPLPHPVNPGETIDLRLNLVAPETPNTYTGNWYLQGASGALFGLGADGVQPLSLTIVVRPVRRPPI